MSKPASKINCKSKRGCGARGTSRPAITAASATEIETRLNMVDWYNHTIVWFNQTLVTKLLDIVSSRVKAELLRLLFGLDPADLHLRELVRQSGLSLGTVQQELRHLRRSGLVIARKDGNRVYYRANSDHPAHSDIRSLVLKTDGLVGVLRSALNHPDISIAFVFGSIARGEAVVTSDIDVMIIGSLGLRRLSSRLSGMADRVGREINPHLLSPDEFAERKKERDHFVTSVLNSPRLFVKGSEDELATVGE
jgi:DNA-binding transcriptional ArsR family regulator